MPITSAWDVTTDEEFAELLESVKEGILEILNDKLVPPVPVPNEKVPRVRNRRIVEIDPNTWAGRLKSPRHVVNGEEQVHTYMVGYGGITSETDDNTVGGKCFQVRFLIDSYYEDKIGTDEDNAEKSHGEEVHRITHALWMSRTLNRPTMVKKIVEFVERRGLAKMGAAITRESLAEIVVDLHAVPMVTP